MEALERRYRALLVGFPRLYRRERGDELVGTLLAAATPGRRWPTVREAVDLLGGGLRVRGTWRCTSARSWWSGVLHGVITLLLLQGLVFLSYDVRYLPGWQPVALLALALLALAGAVLRWYLVLAVAAAVDLVLLALWGGSSSAWTYLLDYAQAVDLLAVLVLLAVLRRLDRDRAEAPPPAWALLVLAAVPMSWMVLSGWTGPPVDVVGELVGAVAIYLVAAGLAVVDVRLPAAYALYQVVGLVAHDLFHPDLLLNPLRIYLFYLPVVALLLVGVLLGRHAVRL